MIFNELFYENNQTADGLLYVRQAGELYKDPDYSISRSDSPTHTVGFLKEGRLKVTVGDERFEISSGQSVFFPCKTEYQIAADCDALPYFFWINLRGKLANSFAEALFDGKITVSDTDIGSEIAELRELIAEKTDNGTKIKKLIFDILLKIQSKALSVEARTEPMSEYELYISNSIQSGFSVKDMAEYFHCSTDTLNRMFLKKYGITPYRYYGNMRMEIAKTMLKKTELTVEDIAERLHFSDRNHFTVCFKNTVGVSPVKYKKGL